MEQRDTPLVSVVIPTFNRGGIVGRAIESALRQTYPAIEVVLVDDASTDDTVSRIAPYLSDKVRLIRRAANGGASAARNVGIAESAGAYVAFLDSDDEWLPEKVQLQVRLLEAAEPDIGMAHTGFGGYSLGRPPVAVRPPYRGNLFELLQWRNKILTASVMIRRRVLADVGGFDEQLKTCEDWDLWLRIARRYRIEVLPQPLVRYHDGGKDQLTGRPGASASSTIAASSSATTGPGRRAASAACISLCWPGRSIGSAGFAPPAGCPGRRSACGRRGSWRRA